MPFQIQVILVQSNWHSILGTIISEKGLEGRGLFFFATLNGSVLNETTEEALERLEA